MATIGASQQVPIQQLPTHAQPAVTQPPGQVSSSAHFTQTPNPSVRLGGKPAIVRVSALELCNAFDALAALGLGAAVLATGLRSSNQSHDDQERATAEARRMTSNDDWRDQVQYCQMCAQNDSLVSRVDCDVHCKDGSLPPPPSLTASTPTEADESIRISDRMVAEPRSSGSASRLSTSMIWPALLTTGLTISTTHRSSTLDLLVVLPAGVVVYCIVTKANVRSYSDGLRLTNGCRMLCILLARAVVVPVVLLIATPSLHCFGVTNNSLIDTSLGSRGPPCAIPFGPPIPTEAVTRTTTGWHRDLRPENILIVDDMDVCLIDFWNEARTWSSAAPGLFSRSSPCDKTRLQSNRRICGMSVPAFTIDGGLCRSSNFRDSKRRMIRVPVDLVDRASRQGLASQNIDQDVVFLLGEPWAGGLERDRQNTALQDEGMLVKQQMRLGRASFQTALRTRRRTPRLVRR